MPTKDNEVLYIKETLSIKERNEKRLLSQIVHTKRLFRAKRNQ